MKKTLILGLFLALTGCTSKLYNNAFGNKMFFHYRKTLRSRNIVEIPINEHYIALLEDKEGNGYFEKKYHYKKTNKEAPILKQVNYDFPPEDGETDLIEVYDGNRKYFFIPNFVHKQEANLEGKLNTNKK